MYSNASWYSPLSHLLKTCLENQGISVMFRAIGQRYEVWLNATDGSSFMCSSIQQPIRSGWSCVVELFYDGERLRMRRYRHANQILLGDDFLKVSCLP